MNRESKRRAACAARAPATAPAVALVVAALALGSPAARAQGEARPAPPTRDGVAAQRAPVVVSGVVPDEASRAQILAKVRELYGANRVVDQLGIGPLVAPPNWSALVQRTLTAELQRVHDGQLKISGNQIDLIGSVATEVERQQVATTLLNQIGNPTWSVRNGLHVGRAEQQVLDSAIADRIIEFEPGNARLTPAGTRVLDDLLPVLRSMGGRRFEIVGHTDSAGPRSQNLALSQARADAVKAWLVGHGVPAQATQTRGAGPDRPVADNATAEGRARNRRIEFRVLA